MYFPRVKNVFEIMKWISIINSIINMDVKSYLYITIISK